MEQWEYNYDVVVSLSLAELHEVMNHYGKKGWEVFAVETFYGSDEDDARGRRIYMKRKIQ